MVIRVIKINNESTQIPANDLAISHIPLIFFSSLSLNIFTQFHYIYSDIIYLLYTKRCGLSINIEKECGI